MQNDNPTLEPAYVLHHRAYRDTSLLVEFLTEKHGRISAVAKGVRSKRSPWRGLLLPGVPLFVSCIGRGELLTLTHAEPNGFPMLLQGNALFSLFYINELLMYLLHRFDPHPQLYIYYTETLALLADTSTLEMGLRLFEWLLMKELGYGLSLDKIASSGESIDLEAQYAVDPELGVLRCSEHKTDWQQTYTGKTLYALANHCLTNDKILLSEAKRLMRKLLQPLLGNREIISRTLYK